MEQQRGGCLTVPGQSGGAAFCFVGRSTVRATAILAPESDTNLFRVVCSDTGAADDRPTSRYPQPPRYEPRIVIPEKSPIPPFFPITTL